MVAERHREGRKSFNLHALMTHLRGRAPLSAEAASIDVPNIFAKVCVSCRVAQRESRDRVDRRRPIGEVRYVMIFGDIRQVVAQSDLNMMRIISLCLMPLVYSHSELRASFGRRHTPHMRPDRGSVSLQRPFRGSPRAGIISGPNWELSTILP